MTDSDFGPVACGQGVYVLLFRAVPLGPSPESAIELPPAKVNKPFQTLASSGNREIVEAALFDPAQPPRSLMRGRHASFRITSLPYPTKGAVDSFVGWLATDPETVFPRLVATVRHAKEVECLRLSLPAFPAVRFCTPLDDGPVNS